MKIPLNFVGPLVTASFLFFITATAWSGSDYCFGGGTEQCRDVDNVESSASFTSSLQTQLTCSVKTLVPRQTGSGIPRLDERASMVGEEDITWVIEEFPRIRDQLTNATNQAVDYMMKVAWIVQELSRESAASILETSTSSLFTGVDSTSAPNIGDSHTSGSSTGAILSSLTFASTTLEITPLPPSKTKPPALVLSTPSSGVMSTSTTLTSATSSFTTSQSSDLTTTLISTSTITMIIPNPPPSSHIVEFDSTSSYTQSSGSQAPSVYTSSTLLGLPTSFQAPGIETCSSQEEVEDESTTTITTTVTNPYSPRTSTVTIPYSSKSSALSSAGDYLSPQADFPTHVRSSSSSRWTHWLNSTPVTSSTLQTNNNYVTGTSRLPTAVGSLRKRTFPQTQESFKNPIAMRSPTPATVPHSKQRRSQSPLADPKSGPVIAAYYRPPGKASDLTLAAQCEDKNIDILVVGFFTPWNQMLHMKGGFDYGPECQGYRKNMMKNAVSQLYYCANLEEEITLCQQKGKKVFVGVGGPNSDIEFIPNTNDTETFAGTLWSTFGPINETHTHPKLRPFGNAVVDGFDFYFQQQAMKDQVAHLGTTLRSWFGTDSTKNYYISASPACSQHEWTATPGYLEECDFVWPQFWNGTSGSSDTDVAGASTPSSDACDIGHADFRATLQMWSDGLAPYSRPRLAIGAPTFPGADSSSQDAYDTVGDADKWREVVEDAKKVEKFGGLMFWESSEGHKNSIGGKDIFALTREDL